MQEAIPTEKEKDCYSKNNNSNLDLLEIKNMRKSKNASGALYPDSIYPGICLENEYNNYCEASAKFSLLYGDLGVFDCRISELPSKEKVIDYFRWRNEDACRNALNAWCYWTLRKEGQKEATKAIEGVSVADKNELLFQRGINFNDLPLWQKRGIGFYWETFDREGAERRRLKIDMELPQGDAYGEYIRDKFLN